MQFYRRLFINSDAEYDVILEILKKYFLNLISRKVISKNMFIILDIV